MYSSRINKEPSEKELIRELSFQYKIDAWQFLDHAKVILSQGEKLKHDINYHVGYLFKINVMLYMSIECSLKALICATCQNLSPYDIYWKRIRNNGHDLNDKIKQIKKFSAIVGDSKLEARIKDFSKKQVKDRYCVEVAAESPLMDDLALDPKCFRKELVQTKCLYRTAKKLLSKTDKFALASFKDVDVLHPKVVRAALNELMKQHN